MATFKHSIVFKIRTEIVSICHRGIVALETNNIYPNGVKVSGLVVKTSAASSGYSEQLSMPWRPAQITASQRPVSGTA
jgi:hypothetical protein